MAIRLPIADRTPSGPPSPTTDPGVAAAAPSVIRSAGQVEGGHAMNSRILDHNRLAAEMWDAGGRSFDDISFAISDALGHAAQRLSPRAGEEILDVATGTGWSARNAARMGARVTAVDIAPALIRAAEALSGPATSAIDYRVADAED